jgi:hypothetical protein
VLFGLYKEFNLENKPLFVIGRRKVDRGLGFHHAPPDGSEGLIWTDMILGRIDDKNTAVQKAGRLAGKVAHCPQYPGNLTWWTDERTANSILSHNTVVDVAGTKRAHTALQAVGHAREEIPALPASPKVPTYKLSAQTFNSVKEAKLWWKDPASAVSEPHDVRVNITQYGIYDGPEGKSIKYRGGLRKIMTETEVRQQQAEIGAHITNNTPARIMPVTTDLQWGIASAARVMPVESEESVYKYVVIYKPDAVYQPRGPRAAGGDDSSSVSTVE